MLSNLFNESVVLSGLGGLAYPLLSFLEALGNKSTKRPIYNDPSYYISIIIYVFFALLVGYAYFNGEANTNKLLAIHIGVSAPLLIRTMANTLPAKVVE